MGEDSGVLRKRGFCCRDQKVVMLFCMFFAHHIEEAFSRFFCALKTNTRRNDMNE